MAAAEDIVSHIEFTGSMPSEANADCNRFLGCYKSRGELVNGRPTYVKTDDEACMIWYYENGSTKRQWHIGLTSEFAAGKLSRAALYLADGTAVAPNNGRENSGRTTFIEIVPAQPTAATTPDAASGTWHANHKRAGHFVAAPGVRMISLHANNPYPVLAPTPREGPNQL